MSLRTREFKIAIIALATRMDPRHAACRRVPSSERFLFGRRLKLDGNR